MKWLCHLNVSLHHYQQHALCTLHNHEIEFRMKYTYIKFSDTASSREKNKRTDMWRTSYVLEVVPRRTEKHFPNGTHSLITGITHDIPLHPVLTLFTLSENWQFSTAIVLILSWSGRGGGEGWCTKCICIFVVTIDSIFECSSS